MNSKDAFEKLNARLALLERKIAEHVPLDVWATQDYQTIIAHIDAKYGPKPTPKHADEPLPKGWFRLLGGTFIAHKISILVIRYFSTKAVKEAKEKSEAVRAVEVSDPAVNKTQPFVDGVRIQRANRLSYAPKMDEAYHMIVNEGKSLVEVSTILNMPYPLLAEWAKAGNWLNKRVKNEELIVRSQGHEKAGDRAEMLKTLLVESVDRAKDRLIKMQRCLERKWDAALGDTEEVTIVDAEGKTHIVRVSKSSEARLAALLELNSKLIRQLQELSDVGGARVIGDAARIRHGKASRKARLARRNAEMAAGRRAPLGEGS